MGIDACYQSIPDECRLLERARHDPEFGAILEFFDSYATIKQASIEHMQFDGIRREFITEVRDLATKHPGLAERKLHAGRRWDMLHYLMSEYRRDGEYRHPYDWVVKVLFGGEALNPETQTTTGHPIRYLTPVEVAELSEQLSQVSPDSLRVHWNVGAMIEAGVYKMHPTDDDRSFQWIIESFYELKRFYAQSASHREGVLVSMG